MALSQAPFCLYTLRAISGRAEGTFGRLRYSLGGDRPSQTARLTLSRVSLLLRLEFRYIKGGIPTSAPRRLASTLPCLPPILYVMYQNPMSGYSKAPWGLSVQSRVTCIFTGTSISPGPSLRQCPNRYTFHAGRNLPDKEFRYLRTVIVTAAVHWGFSPGLRLAVDSFPLPSSTGQVSAPILRISPSQAPVFVVNSRLGFSSVAGFRSTSLGFTASGHPFP